MKNFFIGFEKSAEKSPSGITSKQKEDIKSRSFGAIVGGAVGSITGATGNALLVGKLKKEMGTSLSPITEMGVAKDFKYMSDLVYEAKKKVELLPPSERKAVLEELTDLASLGDSFIKKHKLDEKGVVSKVDLKARNWGPRYNSVSNKVHISTSSPSIALHELGHAADYSGKGGIVKAIARNMAGGATLGIVPVSMIYGDAIKNKIKGTADDKVIDFINAHPYLSTSVGVGLNPLYSEGKASFLALKHIAEEKGTTEALRVAKKVLGPAWGTYATALALPAFGTVGGIHLMKSIQNKNKMKKEAARVSPELQAFIGAGLPAGLISGFVAASKANREISKIQNEITEEVQAAQMGKQNARQLAQMRDSFSSFVNKHPVLVGTLTGGTVGTMAALSVKAHKSDATARRFST